MADPKATANALEARLDQSIARQQKAKTTTFVIGGILLVVMIGYFSWLNIMVRELFTPETVSQIAVDKMKATVPAMTKSVREDMIRSADANVKEVLDTGLKQVPVLRKEAEDWVSYQAKLRLARVDQEFSELVDYAFDNHAADVRSLLIDLKTDEGAKALEDALVDMLSEPLRQSQAEVDIKAYAITLQNLANKMERLREAKNLSEEQRLELEILECLKEFSNRSK